MLKSFVAFRTVDGGFLGVGILDILLLNAKITTTMGSNTVIFLRKMPYSERKFPHFAWKFPLQSVFANVVIFAMALAIFHLLLLQLPKMSYSLSLLRFSEKTFDAYYFMYFFHISSTDASSSGFEYRILLP